MIFLFHDPLDMVSPAPMPDSGIAGVTCKSDPAYGCLRI